MVVVVYWPHTTQTVRNKHEKLARKGEASFDTPILVQSHAESIKKVQPNSLNYGRIGCASQLVVIKGLVSWQIIKGSHDFLHTFSMALYHKWGVKNDFVYVLQIFSLISDRLGGVAAHTLIFNFVNRTFSAILPNLLLSV